MRALYAAGCTRYGIKEIEKGLTAINQDARHSYIYVKPYGRRIGFSDKGSLPHRSNLTLVNSLPHMISYLKTRAPKS